MPAAFTDQVVLITGASRGIGAATALAFAREAARVVINYHSDEAGARQTLAQIKSAGGHATAVRADISQPADVERLVAMVESEIGPLRVLVNNAAAFSRAPFLEVSLAELELAWTTNVRGLFYVSQLAARCMAERRQGCLIHVSSILAHLAVANRTAYCATKGAIESLTRAMALDLAPQHVRVNAVAPGLIRTEALLAGFSDPARLATLEQYIPDGRLGEADDVAQVIVFLASEAAGYINGAVIPVDGALGAREAGPLLTARPVP
jgi:NAD(P)-dependent dehydrogenase (short-subunit alcohol dehydrogenase family)